MSTRLEITCMEHRQTWSRSMVACMASGETTRQMKATKSTSDSASRIPIRTNAPPTIANQEIFVNVTEASIMVHCMVTTRPEVTSLSCK